MKRYRHRPARPKWVLPAKMLVILGLGCVLLNVGLALPVVRNAVGGRLGEHIGRPLRIEALGWWPPFTPVTAEGVFLREGEVTGLPVEPGLRKVSLHWDWANIVRGEMGVTDVQFEGPILFSDKASGPVRRRLTKFRIPLSSLLKALKPGFVIPGSLNCDLEWDQEQGGENDVTLTVDHITAGHREIEGTIHLDSTLSSSADLEFRNISGDFCGGDLTGRGLVKAGEPGAPFHMNFACDRLQPTWLEGEMLRRTGVSFYGGSWSARGEVSGDAAMPGSWDFSTQFLGDGSVLRVGGKTRVFFLQGVKREWRVNLIRGKLTRQAAVWKIEGFDMDCEPIHFTLEGTVAADKSLSGHVFLKLSDTLRDALEKAANKLKLPDLTFERLPELRPNLLRLEISGVWPEVKGRWQENMEPVLLPLGLGGSPP